MCLETLHFPWAQFFSSLLNSNVIKKLFWPIITSRFSMWFFGYFQSGNREATTNCASKNNSFLTILMIFLEVTYYGKE